MVSQRFGYFEAPLQSKEMLAFSAKKSLPDSNDVN